MCRLTQEPSSDSIKRNEIVEKRDFNLLKKKMEKVVLLRAQRGITIKCVY